MLLMSKRIAVINVKTSLLHLTKIEKAFNLNTGYLFYRTKDVALTNKQKRLSCSNGNFPREIRVAFT